MLSDGGNTNLSLPGKRPYSPFGLFHNIEKEQARMRDECFERYPGLHDEILAFSKDGNKRGVVAFLLDTLIDVENLGFKEVSQPKEQQGVQGGPVGGGDAEQGKVEHGILHDVGYPIK